MGVFDRQDPAAETRVASVLAGATARELVDVEVPRTGVRGKMRILSRSESMSIRSELIAEFKAQGMLSEDGRVLAIASDDWRLELGARTLALAVRCQDDPGEQLAPAVDWRSLDDDQLSGMLDAYSDLRDRMDPLADDSPLTEGEIQAIEAASKKKDAVVLRLFGLHKLVTYAITTAGQPANSATPK